MLYVRRVTDAAEVARPIAEQSLAGEEACLRITRTGFALSYIPAGAPEWRVFPRAAGAEPAAVLRDPSAALFGAFAGDLCIGTAAVRAEETRWSRLLDIRVDAQFRRQGAGRLLLESCAGFGHSVGMQGICADTTDTNPVMCQFLEHCGFQVGGIDRMRLILTPSEREKPLMRRACGLTFYLK